MPRAATSAPAKKSKAQTERDLNKLAQMTQRQTLALASGLSKTEAMALMSTTWTPQQEAFVKHWAQGESVYAASVRAGYTDGGAFCYALIKRPEVIARYEKEKRLYEEASQMTRKKVMDGLLEAVEMAKLMAEPATMVAGWREIGKMCGYYEPVQKRIDVNLTGNLVLERMNKMSDAELLKLIQTSVTEQITHQESQDDGE